MAPGPLRQLRGGPIRDGTDAFPLLPRCYRSRELAERAFSTAKRPPTFNFTFSEQVTGVDLTDFPLAFTSLRRRHLVLAAVDGANYSVSVSGMSGFGQVGLISCLTGYRERDGIL